MSKSKIVSYTSEDLKQMTSESDWAAADAMTEEEIEAAIASDPEEAAMYKGWMQRATVVRPKPHFFMCVNNKGYKQNLTVHKVYKIILDADAEQQELVRIVDDSGKDATYPISLFLPVALSVEAEETFAVQVA
jgi:hypothetical protein